MPWQIQNGKPVKVTPEVSVGPGPAEIPAVTQVVEDRGSQVAEFRCPICDKPYKTEDGRDNHVDAKHTTDPSDEEQ